MNVVSTRYLPAQIRLGLMRETVYSAAPKNTEKKKRDKDPEAPIGRRKKK